MEATISISTSELRRDAAKHPREYRDNGVSTSKNPVIRRSLSGPEENAFLSKDLPEISSTSQNFGDKRHCAAEQNCVQKQQPLDALTLGNNQSPPSISPLQALIQNNGHPNPNDSVTVANQKNVSANSSEGTPIHASFPDRPRVRFPQFGDHDSRIAFLPPKHPGVHRSVIKSKEDALQKISVTPPSQALVDKFAKNGTFPTDQGILNVLIPKAICDSRPTRNSQSTSEVSKPWDYCDQYSSPKPHRFFQAVFKPTNQTKMSRKLPDVRLLHHSDHLDQQTESYSRMTDTRYARDPTIINMSDLVISTDYKSRHHVQNGYPAQPNMSSKNYVNLASNEESQNPLMYQHLDRFDDVKRITRDILDEVRPAWSERSLSCSSSCSGCYSTCCFSCSNPSIWTPRPSTPAVDIPKIQKPSTADINPCLPAPGACSCTHCVTSRNTFQPSTPWINPFCPKCLSPSDNDSLDSKISNDSLNHPSIFSLDSLNSLTDPDSLEYAKANVSIDSLDSLDSFCNCDSLSDSKDSGFFSCSLPPMC